MHAGAHQDVALKDLITKGMVIGVAINQRQFEGTDAAAVDLITKQELSAALGSSAAAQAGFDAVVDVLRNAK